MKIFLYQIWYDDKTKPDENSGFLAFDCRKEPEFLKREIAHLIRFYDEIVIHASDDDYFALLSPRFFDKTGLTPQDVREFVLTNPNQDVYLFNPCPIHVYTYLNIWEQGEESHHHLKELTQKLLNTAGINFDIFSNHRNTIYNTVYCNYWLGSKSFFDNFIRFIKHLDKTIESLPNEERKLYFSETTYFRTTAIFYPFIFERLICLYLLINQNLNIKPYIYQPHSSVFKKSHLIYRKFYFSACRELYDELEKNEKDNAKVTANFQLLNQYINPNFSLFPFKLLNNLVNAMIKISNAQKLDKLLISLSKN